ncbi:MAG: succinylglutamate desuccinylase/aspartoacylase family protein [Burkholderiales bacterium]|nr:succinylglutamate desuccinylase/aspartoacylase family protein [Burkholderiales bacterium]
MNARIETPFPDIRRWSDSNTGLPYVWSFRGTSAGPHVCVNALVHGNEVCGAIAADALLREMSSGLQPARGTLSIAFANVDAYHAFDAAKPFESRCVDEDFNRLWDIATLDGPRDSRELRRARQLRPFYDTVDHLLDLHSMLEPAPPIALAGDTAKGLALANAVGVPPHALVDSGHAAGKRLRDYTGFGDPASPKTALLVECGQHWEAAVADVAMQATLRFLAHFGMLDVAWLATRGVPGTPPTTAQKVIDITQVVTVQSPAFRWIHNAQGLEVIAEAGTLLAIDGEREVRTQHANAVLVMPVPQPKVGQTAVRVGAFREG